MDGTQIRVALPVPLLPSTQQGDRDNVEFSMEFAQSIEGCYRKAGLKVYRIPDCAVFRCSPVQKMWKEKRTKKGGPNTLRFSSAASQFSIALWNMGQMCPSCLNDQHRQAESRSRWACRAPLSRRLTINAQIIDCTYVHTATQKQAIRRPFVSSPAVLVIDEVLALTRLRA